MIILHLIRFEEANGAGASNSIKKFTCRADAINNAVESKQAFPLFRARLPNDDPVGLGCFLPMKNAFSKGLKSDPLIESFLLNLYIGDSPKKGIGNHIY